MTAQTATRSRRGWNLQTVVIAALAVLLFPVVVIYPLRMPLAALFINLLILFCPCVSSTCAECACDACAYRVLAAVALFLVGVPVGLYILVHRRRRLR